MLTLSCFLVDCCFEHDLCQASLENSAMFLLIVAPEKLQAIRVCRDSFSSFFCLHGILCQHRHTFVTSGSAASLHHLLGHGFTWVSVTC